MKSKMKSISTTTRYLLLLAFISILANSILGVLLTRQSNAAIRSQMRARMLDISNTAAFMLDGDVLRDITPEDKGTADYESIMRILTGFQDNIELSYIYCIRDEGNKNFVFGLDPAVEDPAEFGSPIVYTDALYRASRGTSAVDEIPYEDAWGCFYSAYSPVFDSSGKVAGIVGVDFSKEWYDEQLEAMVSTTVITCAASLLAAVAIATLLIVRNRKRIRGVNEQINKMSVSFETLMREVHIMSGSGAGAAGRKAAAEQQYDIDDLDSLMRKFSTMQKELRFQAEKIHEQACYDRTTGVMNKESYQSVRGELDDMIREGRAAFSVMIFSVNELGPINRLYGQESGDAALTDAANVLSSVYGKERVFRIGGGEFRVIADTTSEQNIKNGFSKVDFRMATENTKEKNYQMPISFSMGYAVYDRETDREYADVYHRADQMMNAEKASYNAKQNEA